MACTKILIDFSSSFPIVTLLLSLGCDPKSGLDGKNISGADCRDLSAERDCGEDKVQFCDDVSAWDEPEQLRWGECLDIEDLECELGDTTTCTDEFGNRSTVRCLLEDGRLVWDHLACATPLVLQFDDVAVDFVSTPLASFDVSNAGCSNTDWPTAATPWLALDHDKNGNIDAGHELFGSGVTLVDGRKAKNGFLALAELDDNGDRKIDAKDSRFAELVLWADHDADKRSDFSEMIPVEAAGLISIDLNYSVRPRCDASGNCGIERAEFLYRNTVGQVEQGEVVDVHLVCR